MPSSLLVVLYVLVAIVASVGVFLAYVLLRYTPITRRVFEEKPVFFPLRVEQAPGGEEVRFQTPDHRSLAGSYYPARTLTRTGQVVFCHEFLADRFTAAAYADQLRDLGFDLFCFDFRNHGQSDSDPGYEPLQWVTEQEVADVRAALDYVSSRRDADPAGVALFGISKGGSAALCLAADDPRVWAVITDGAFPTRGTVCAYMHRWADIYVGIHKYWMRLSARLFNRLIDIVAAAGVRRSERGRGCRFPDVEGAVARLAPRPWLMVHGGDDVYISLEIARRFFQHARSPKELWIVNGAKHNRCREADPQAYDAQVASFLKRYAPRLVPAQMAHQAEPAEPRASRSAARVAPRPAAAALVGKAARQKP